MHDNLLSCFACLACLFGSSSCQLCLPTSRLLDGWFCLLSLTKYWLVFACLACLLFLPVMPALPACSSCQLCLPTIRLLAGWFCLLCLPVFWLILPVMPAYNRLLVDWFCLLFMTIYWLVLPALPACLFAYLASYGCLLAACWLAGFAGPGNRFPR
jgi:hypothetical protein